jgi:uncharacterized protein YcbX
MRRNVLCDAAEMRLVSIHTYPVKGCHRLDHDGAEVQPWGLAGDRRWMVVDQDGVGVTQRELTALVALRPTTRPGGLVLRAEGRPALDVPEPHGGDPIKVRVFSVYDSVPAIPADPAAGAWLSALLDQPVRLVWLGDPGQSPIPDPAYGDVGGRVSFADGFPLLLANSASLDVLNDWLLESGSVEAPLPMTRFRPNVVVGGGQPWVEDDWVGRLLRIGEVRFRAAYLCGRCVVTTTDQETGERGHEPLRVLASHRQVGQKLLFGLNLMPEPNSADAAGDPPIITVDDSVELVS